MAATDVTRGSVSADGNGSSVGRAARRLATELGFPLLLKAAAGGGGRGMRLVLAEDELDAAFQTAAAEAQAIREELSSLAQTPSGSV